MTIVIGYILGIIWGLYFKTSIVLLYILIAFFYGFMQLFNTKKHGKFKLISIHRYVRYIKLILTKQVIFLIVISSIISNTILKFQEIRYENLYSEGTINVEGIIISNKQEKDHKTRYKLKVLSVNNIKSFRNTRIYIDVKNENEFQYGDKLKLKGEFIKGSKQRNYGGFDYQLYLKSIKIYGTLKVENFQKSSSNTVTVIEKSVNNVKLAIKENIEKIMQKKYQQIVKGLILGDISLLDEELKEKFQIANISHVLAVSGMHMIYIIIGIEMLFKRILGKRNVKYLQMLGLVLYMSITGLTSSIARAGIMEIINVIAFLVYRKKDIWTSISVSLLMILIENPYAITRCGITVILPRNSWHHFI